MFKSENNEIRVKTPPNQHFDNIVTYTIPIAPIAFFFVLHIYPLRVLSQLNGLIGAADTRWYIDVGIFWLLV